MTFKFSVEPFDAQCWSDWQMDKHYLVVSFFDTEIFRLEVKGEYISENDLDDVVEVAKQELGRLLSERLSARIKPGEFSGVKIGKRED